MMHAEIAMAMGADYTREQGFAKGPDLECGIPLDTR
jgi:hypothetical protein